MNIGIMGAWNTDSGASVHTELIGRGFVELGHKVVVFTFFKNSFHGTQIVQEDEDYVIRCFTTSAEKNPKLLATPFLIHEYELFIVEDLGMLPYQLLGFIFHRIKKKAKTVNVIHDGRLKEDPVFYQFDWDAVVCFDSRYYEFLKLAYPKEIIHIIQYPCMPYKVGDKEKSAENLNLPLDKKIIFSFGPASKYTADKFYIFKKLAKDYPIFVLIVTKDESSLRKWKRLKRKNPKLIEIRQEAPGIDRLYQYLHAADVFFYNKKSVPGTVTVASSIFQCLGSGCPTVALESTFVETLKDVVFLYKTDEDLKTCVKNIFEKDEKYQKIMENAKNFVETNSGKNIAKKFLELFR